MPKISVIVPVYNVESYLMRCVQSILRQSFDDFELILVNDGSTDGSYELCKNIAALDPRVVVLTQENQGQAVARNQALDWVEAHSDSEWITFVDSDDWIEPQMLEVLYRASIENGTLVSVCSFASTNRDAVLPENENTTIYIESSEDFYCKYSDTWAVVPWGKLYRRECLHDVRFPAVRACEDEFVTYKLLFHADTLSVSNARLYNYFMRADSTMHKKWNKNRLAIIDAVEERLVFFEKIRKKKAWEHTVKFFILNTLYEPLIYIERLPYADTFVKEQRLLKRRLRLELLRYRKKGGTSIQNYVWVYEKVFPHFMNLYWFVQHLQNKIKQSLK